MTDDTTASDTAAAEIPQVGDYWRDPDVPDAVCFTVTNAEGKHLVSHVIGPDGPVPLYARWELTPAKWCPSPPLPDGRAGEELPSLRETLDAVRWLASDALDVLRSDWREAPTSAQADARRAVTDLLSQVKATIDTTKDTDETGNAT